MVDRLPPFDLEAEESTIAALMVDADATYKVMPLLQPSDFFREKHGYIYEACVSLQERNEAINQITVAHELMRRERLEECGGQTFLAELIRNLPTSLGVEFYAGIVKRDSTYRALIHAASGIMQIGYEAPADLKDALSHAENLLDRVCDAEAHDELRSMHDILIRDGYREKLYAHMMDMHAITGLRTGWPKLDSILDGWGHGTLTTLAGESSAGKSLFIQNAMLHQVNEGNGVICFSTEMSAENVARRLMMLNAGVDSARARRTQEAYTTQQYTSMEDTLDSQPSWPIYVHDGASLTTSKIRNTVRRTVRKHEGRVKDWLVIVDLVDRVRGNHQQRAEDLTIAVQDLQGFVREENVAGIITSHVNRSDGGGNRLNKLADSGAKAKDVDNVLFLQPVARKEDGWKDITPDEYRIQISTYGYCHFSLLAEKTRMGMQSSLMMTMSWWTGGGRFEEYVR